MPFGTARYGANILGFTNSDPCVVNVDSTQFFQIGDFIRIANSVSTTNGSQINGDYLITDLTGNMITIEEDTTLFGSYISGGFVTIIQYPNAQNTPFLQSNFNIPVLPWTVFNQARGGGYIPLI